MPHRSIAHIISQQTPVTATADLTVREACQRMAAARVGALLVVEHGFLTGIFTERDALNRVLAPGLDPEHTLLSEVMTANPVSVRPETLATEALRIMETREIDNLPVVDGDGIVAGVVDIQDLMKLRVL